MVGTARHSELGPAACEDQPTRPSSKNVSRHLRPFYRGIRHHRLDGSKIAARGANRVDRLSVTQPDSPLVALVTDGSFAALIGDRGRIPQNRDEAGLY